MTPEFDHILTWGKSGHTRCSCERWGVVVLPTVAGERVAREKHAQHVIEDLRGRLQAALALADRWERENRRPSGPGDQVGAGVWSATKAAAAELRAVLVSSPGHAPQTQTGGDQ